MAQVLSGSFDTNGYNGKHLNFSWTGTQSISGNYTDVSWTLKGAGGSGYHMAGDFTVIIDDETVYSSAPRIELWNGTVVATGTKRIYHNDNGTRSFSASVSASIYTFVVDKTGSGTWELNTIPRYTSITQFEVAKRNETSVTVTWNASDSCDKIWYSKDNGSSWTETSGYPTFVISGLSPNTTYNFKIRVRRTDSQLTTDSSTVSQTTYKAPSQSLKSKTETSITMNWSIDSTANYIWYSIDNGSNWTAVGSVNATSGSYTISGLTANTSYNIKTRVRRSATSTTYDTSASSQTTYNYPYVSAVGTSDLEIGKSQTLTLYNPLGRSCSVYMKKNSTSGTQLYSDTTTGTSITFTPTASTLYASIPSATSGNCVYYCTYSSQTVSTKSGTYKIKGTEIPTFTNFTYKDSNNTVVGVTGNDQIMVKGLSTVQVTVSSANKMVANNSATAKNYVMTMGSLSDTVNYSTSDIVDELGTISASGTQRLTVTAYDSRDLYKSVYKDITVYDYAKPVINATLTRLNSFEAETTLHVAGTYTKLTINNTNKNTITGVKYRYRETGGSWGSWVNLTTTVNNGTFTCSDVILSLDNSKTFEFQIQATDNLQTNTVNSNVDIGLPIFFISSNTKKVGINKFPTGSADLQVAGGVDVAGQLTATNNSSSVVSRANNIRNTLTNPTTGTWYYPTFINGTTNNGYYAERTNDGFRYYTQEGTASANGRVIASLGNATASGTAGNKYGQLRLYGKNTGYSHLEYANSTTNVTHTLPATTGTIALLQTIYPVGSIYMSTVSTNPNTILGFGTWEQISGRFLYCTTTSKTTGGASSVSYTPAGTVGNHTLTANEIPAHSHSLVYANNGKEVSLDTGGSAYNLSWGSSGIGGGNLIASNTGGGQAHKHGFTGTKATINTMPPWFSVYCWHRTA